MALYTEPFRKAFFLRLQSLKNVFSDFPGGTADRNLPANVETQVQCLVRKIPHHWQLSPCTATIEPYSRARALP